MGGRKIQKAPKREMASSTFFDGLKSAASIYDPRRAKDALMSAMGASDLKTTFAVLLLAWAVTSAFAFLTALESIYLVNYSSDFISQVSGTPQPMLVLADINPILSFQVLLGFFGIIYTVADEAAAFWMLRLIGGRGGFRTQFHLAAVIGLAGSFMGALGFFAPLPCLQILSAIAILVLTIYLAIYTRGVSYSIVHGVDVLHAVGIVLLLIVPRIVIMIIMADALAAYLGMPSPMTFAQGV
jgi:hypothetical protein